MPSRTAASDPAVWKAYETSNSTPRTSTQTSLVTALHERYPHLILTITATEECDLDAFAKAGHAFAELDNSDSHSVINRKFVPPVRRLDEGNGGSVEDQIVFAKCKYRWSEHDFIIYCADGQEGSWMDFTYNYILSHPEGEENVYGKSSVAEQLIAAATLYTAELHEEILVYDEGRWKKDKNLWQDMQSASWNDVVLKGDIKDALTDDIQSFYDKKPIYRQYAVPWKRGIIFHGPPGNGKTISIKAMMRALSYRANGDGIPVLYIKSFATGSACLGPETSIRKIFKKARSLAPCLLILEDVDSFIKDELRSYFLNEVDGLASNDGILMVGTTNHLERLDAGISKRPSRFDRTYLFDNPNAEERTKYAEYWRNKLSSNPSITFPPELCQAISSITDGLSFAFIKEAFVASLLLIVTRGSSDAEKILGDASNSTALASDSAGSTNENKESEIHDKSFGHLILWQEIKKQVKTLRESIAAEEEQKKDAKNKTDADSAASSGSNSISNARNSVTFFASLCFSLASTFYFSGTLSLKTYVPLLVVFGLYTWNAYRQ